jgi:multidrug resistance efflux pump
MQHRMKTKELEIMSEKTTELQHEDPVFEQKKTYRATRILLAIIALIFAWYVVSDRLTPFTNSARLQAFVIPVVPDVSGYIQDIPVAKYELAEPGQILLQIDPQRFQLAVQLAEAALAVAGQDVGAGTQGVAGATAQVTKAQVALNEARTQAQRYFSLETKGVVSRAEGDQARSIVASAEAELEAVRAELERQKEALGDQGGNNPRVRYALAQLKEAQLNLARTTIKAHTRGFVGSRYIDEGAYAKAGEPVLTFMSLEEFWVEAYMTENNLGRVTPGDKVELVFDAFPGKIYHGKVKKTAPGVSTGKTTDLGSLSTAKQSSGWLRSPQSFSVIIETTDYVHDPEAVKGLRHNSQADVIIYTGDGFFWNSLGWLWIRLVSVLSFVY